VLSAKNSPLEPFIFAFLATKIATTVFCAYRISQLKLAWKFSAIDLKKLKEMLFFGAPLILTSLTGWLLLLSDRFFINCYGTLSDIGIYAVAYKLSTSLTIALVQPFAAVWEPTVFKLFAEDQEMGYHKVEKDFKKYLAAFVILFSAMLLFIDDFLILLFSDSIYTKGTSLFPFLIASQFLMALGEMWGTVCRLNKTSRFAFTVTFFAITAKIGLNSALIPMYLLTGAAFASYAAEICSQSVMAYYAKNLSAPRNLFFSLQNLGLIAVFMALQMLVYFFPHMHLTSKGGLLALVSFLSCLSLRKNKAPKLIPA